MVNGPIKMKIPPKNRIPQSVVGILTAVLLMVSSHLRLPALDDQADEFFSTAIAQATVAYATCRVVNGSVSVLKESDFQLQPAGVGVSLAIGQALDPIDDMVERASDVLVMSITSLGLQKLIYEISVRFVPFLLGVLLLLFSCLALFQNPKLTRLQTLLCQLMLLFLVARLCLPISAGANRILDRDFFQPRIEEARKELAVGTQEVSSLMELTLPEIDGLRGTMNNSVSFVKTKSVEFREGLGSVVANAGNLVENLLSLTFLYVGVFLVQVILLPVSVIWLLIKLANSFFRPLGHCSLLDSSVRKDA